MSQPAAWIQKKKKVDLKELCEDVGLPSDGFKPDLEQRLQAYIDGNATLLASNKSFAGYFSSLEPKSPVKTASGTSTKRRKTIAPPESTDDDVPEVPRKTTQRTVPSSTGSSLSARTPRTTALKLAQSVPLPPSPAQVATAIERSAAAMKRQLITASSRLEFLGDYPHAARYALSNVQSINVLFLVLELLFLLKSLIPLTYEITIPGVKAAGTEDHTITLPDFFVLLSIAGFWAPFITWASVSVIMPLFVAYFVNPTSYPASYPATRQATKNEKTVDPVIFSIARASVAWLVFTKGLRLFGLFGDKSVAGVHESVGLEAVYLGTAVSGAVALYEAVLKKK